MEGFTIKCKKCGAETVMTPMIKEIGFSKSKYIKFSNGDIEDTSNPLAFKLSCKCGNQIEEEI